MAQLFTGVITGVIINIFIKLNLMSFDSTIVMLLCIIYAHVFSLKFK